MYSIVLELVIFLIIERMIVFRICIVFVLLIII